VTAAALYTTGTAKKKKKSGWGGSSTERWKPFCLSIIMCSYKSISLIFRTIQQIIKFGRMQISCWIISGINRQKFDLTIIRCIKVFPDVSERIWQNTSG
jgi:hypothetical protein